MEGFNRTQPTSFSVFESASTFYTDLGHLSRCSIEYKSQTSMASVFTAPTLNYSPLNRSTVTSRKIGNSVRICGVKAMHVEKSLEELYNVRVERNVSAERLKQLGVSKWSVWKTGKCKLPWDWQVDQLVYIEEGEVRVVPEGSKRFMQFVAGDLVRYPKWFEADLWFNAPYQERYSFRAYGDDC